MAHTDTLPTLLDIDQLAQHLGTSHRHIRRLIAERRIPYVKVGRLVRFDPDEITDWIDRGRRPTEVLSARGR
jgi:excisionase family DNA binding protein